MRECDDRDVPCHRVVAAGGALGGYGGHLEAKRSLLRAEGVTVVGRRIRKFGEVRWTSPRRRSRAARCHEAARLRSLAPWRRATVNESELR